MTESAHKKWFLLALLSFAGAMVYTFPFLRYSYYDTMKAALDVSHTEMGYMQMVNGIASTLGYIPGGWLADRYSPRKLLAVSLVATGLSGFYFATFPSYVGGLFLYGFWGVSTLIIFWAPFIKATRNLGPDEEQGRLFGFLEGGRGVFGFLIGMFTLFVFNHMGQGAEGLRWVILISAVCTVGAGLAIWFLFEDAVEEEQSSPVMQNFMIALRTPQVWFIAAIIFCGYGLFATQSYITPYMTGPMGAVVAFGAFMGILRTYGLQAIGAPASGIIADRIGSPTKVIIGAFIVSGFCIIAFLLIPAQAEYLPWVTAVMIILGLCVFALRGNFYATFSESSIPTHMMGTAVGAACFIGYLPEAFTYPMVGHWLDTYPGLQGYQIMFYYMLGLAIAGILVACLLHAYNKREQPSDVCGG